MKSTTKYFYVTIHFMPRYEENFIHVDKDVFRSKENGMLFRKRLLYDFGWGQEVGFEMLPSLPFDKLIRLVENSVVIKKKKFGKYSQELIRDSDVSQSNLFGAISVIMQDHIEELIEFLSYKIKTDYFSDAIIRKNYRWFSFSTKKMRELGYIPGGILTKSCEDVLNEYEQWGKISKIVIEQVYQ